MASAFVVDITVNQEEEEKQDCLPCSEEVVEAIEEDQEEGSEAEEEALHLHEQEAPYYEETKRTLVGHTRSGRPVYSVKRLIVSNPEVEMQNRADEQELQALLDMGEELPNASDDESDGEQEPVSEDESYVDDGEEEEDEELDDSLSEYSSDDDDDDEQEEEEEEEEDNISHISYESVE